VIYIVIVEIILTIASLNSKDSRHFAVIISMKTDKRRNLRFELPVNVKITTKSGQETILKSQDVSDCGIFLRGDASELPLVGEYVQVQLATMVAGDKPRELNAQVVRQNNDGIGIEFILDDDE